MRRVGKWLGGRLGQLALVAAAVVAVAFGWWGPTPPRLTIPTGGEHVIFGATPDGRYLLTSEWLESSHAYGEIWIWDTTTGEQRALIQLPANYTSLLHCLSPDGKQLAAVAGSTICLFEVPSGDVGPQIPVKPPERVVSMPDGTQRVPITVRFTPDGTRLVFHEHGPDQLAFWDLASRRRVATVSGVIPPFACSPDGRWLAAVDAKGPWLVHRTSQLL
jgi:hypothetical protein